ncbi:translation initiation factor IF-2-like [Megalops cyprinoides]|uniref:translation initiation factor IF-2-like n=1 Tax=Megalops cyprinoides TaxID=118141 RepID=UPI001863AEB7|nr:translation initiation factor IF-2-like [Megalops cyprinoides]
MQDNEEYDPDTQYGSSFMVPVAGFLCRLCHQFYQSGSTARLKHCRSLLHFQNLQKYRALKKQGDPGETEPGTGNSTVEAHLALGEQDGGARKGGSRDGGLEVDGSSSGCPRSMGTAKGWPEDPASSDRGPDSSCPPVTSTGQATARPLPTPWEEGSPLTANHQDTSTASPPASCAPNEEEPEEEQREEDPAKGEQEEEAVAGEKSATVRTRAAPKRRSGRAARRR